MKTKPSGRSVADSKGLEDHPVRGGRRHPPTPPSIRLFVATALLVSTCGCSREAPAPATGVAPAPAAATGEAPPAAPVVASASVEPWFQEVSSELGVDFVHDPGPSRNDLPAIVGSGVAVFDADGDEDLDLYLLNVGATSIREPRPDSSPNRFYRQGADGRFTDATDESGLGDRGHGMGVAVGDVDNDGDLDLYLANFGTDHLFLNDGKGRFSDAGTPGGIEPGGWSTSATFLDADADGWLDILVARYVHLVPGPDAPKCFAEGGRPDFCGPLAYPPDHDLYLHNDGDGTFTDRSEAAGLAQTHSAGLGVVLQDFDADGDADVYVANDAYPNNLWLNDGAGRFTDKAVLTGAAYNALGQAEAGMGVVAEDFDGDGIEDLFMTHLRLESNTLYRSTGPGRGFRDVTSAAGLATPSLRYTGFGVAAFDLELDGDLDLVIANGRVNRLPPEGRVDAAPPWDWLAEPNLLFVNDGKGGFDELSTPEVAAFTAFSEVSRTVAAVDLDRDGDLDLIVTNVGGPARIFRNQVPRKGHWLALRAIDPRLHRDAIGAEVTVVAGERRWVRTVRTSSGYLTAHPAELHFGVGAADKVERIEVAWPDGARERFPGMTTDRAAVLRRGEGEALNE